MKFTHTIYSNLQVNCIRTLIDSIYADTKKYQGATLVKALAEVENILNSGTPCELGESASTDTPTAKTEVLEGEPDRNPPTEESGKQLSKRDGLG